MTEIKELVNYCDWESTSDYKGSGIAGMIVKSQSNNDVQIFLPFAGEMYSSNKKPIKTSQIGTYWSSTAQKDGWFYNLMISKSESTNAKAGIVVDNATSGINTIGLPVRAVRNK